MTELEVIAILHAMGVVMCGISLWIEREEMMPTRGLALKAVLLAFIPVVNYVSAVFLLTEGDWGRKAVKW